MANGDYWQRPWPHSSRKELKEKFLDVIDIAVKSVFFHEAVLNLSRSSKCE